MMKKLRALQTILGKKSIQASGLAVLAAVLAGTFWTASAAFAGGPPMCTVCHKRTQTQQYPCNSLEYARHLDHGDPMGACATPTVSERSRKIAPLDVPPPVLAGD